MRSESTVSRSHLGMLTPRPSILIFVAVPQALSHSYENKIQIEERIFTVGGVRFTLVMAPLKRVL